ncbi:MAG: hypothetical protein HRT72_07415 [Flavobacteriales bacterium]|nr:hypothetical protein [Flavobacteriales bacterium]
MAFWTVHITAPFCFYHNTLYYFSNPENAQNLYKEFEGDGSAWWLYSNVLLHFANKCSEVKLKKLFKEAMAYNPYVVPFLLEQKPLPKYSPGYYGRGDDNEAISYAIDGIKAWISVDGSLNWLSKYYNI